jgi:hypothetical protein
VWCSLSDRKQELEQLVDTARQEKYEISLKLQVPVLLFQTPRIVVERGRNVCWTVF